MFVYLNISKGQRALKSIKLMPESCTLCIFWESHGTHTCLTTGGFSHTDRLPECLRLHLVLMTCAQISHRKDLLFTTECGKTHCTVSGLVKVYTALRLKLRPCLSNSDLQQQQFLSSGRMGRPRPRRCKPWDAVGPDVFVGSSSICSVREGASISLPPRQSTSAPTAGSGSSNGTEAEGRSGALCSESVGAVKGLPAVTTLSAAGVSEQGGASVAVREPSALWA